MRSRKSTLQTQLGVAKSPSSKSVASITSVPEKRATREVKRLLDPESLASGKSSKRKTRTSLQSSQRNCSDSEAGPIENEDWCMICNDGNGKKASMEKDDESQRGK